MRDILERRKSLTSISTRFWTKSTSTGLDAHPEYGNKGNYYNKLDPQSAEAMPPTGNPEIDAKVQKAKRLKEIIKKKA